MKAKIIDYIRESIINAVASSKLVRKFQKSPSPAWTVWLADMLIVLCATLLIATMHGMSVDGHSGFFYSLPVKAIIITAVYSLTSWIYGTYRYVVRLSAITDVLRTVKLIVTSSLLLVVIDIVGELATGVRYFSFWNIVTIAVVSFSLMIVMRLSIKYLYAKLSSRGLTRTPVVILGTNLNSIHVAAALQNEILGQYEPVAFLAINPESRDKINGIKVLAYDQDHIKEVFEKAHASTLLFTTGQLEVVRTHYADIFLNAGIKLLVSKTVSEMNEEGASGKASSMSANVRNIHIEDLLERGSPYVPTIRAPGKCLRARLL